MPSSQCSVTTPKPAIYFGLVAFEMEGAAVWETFPCLVIKGACDYSDICKAKLFKLDAAATAAAYTKASWDSWESPQMGDYR